MIADQTYVLYSTQTRHTYESKHPPPPKKKKKKEEEEEEEEKTGCS